MNWFTKISNIAGRGIRSVIKRLALWKEVDCMGGRLNDGTWTMHKIYIDTIFKSFFRVKSTKRTPYQRENDHTWTDMLRALDKLRSQTPLAFLRWFFKHNREIAQELYNHFLDPDKNHSFSLLAYYNAGYKSALKNEPLTEEEEFHLKHVDRCINPMVTFTFYNFEQDFSISFFERMRIKGYESYGHLYNELNTRWEVVFTKVADSL